MGKKGREHVEKYHDVTKEVISLKDLYTTLYNFVLKVSWIWLSPSKNY